MSRRRESEEIAAHSEAQTEVATVAPPNAPGDPDWSGLAERIRSDKADGTEDLYRLFSKGIRYYLTRRLHPQEVEDKVHEVFVAIVLAIRRGKLRHPEHLPSFVSTIVMQQAGFDSAVPRAKAGPDRRGNRNDGDHAPNIERILPVIAHTVAVFGDEQKASHWLTTPLPLLDNRPPSQLLDSQPGIDLVEQILTRIEHNILS